MKKIVLFVLMFTFLFSIVSCGGGGGITIKAESELGKKVSAEIVCPGDVGIVYSEGDDKSCAYFTDEEDCYELIIEIIADSYTDYDYFRTDSEIYTATRLGTYESFLRDEGDILIYYIPLGTLGDELVYLEVNVYSLAYDSSVDLKSVMASAEISELISSISHSY